MISGTIRLLVLAGAATTLASCGADRRFAPDGEGALLAALGGSNAPSNLTTLVTHNEADLRWRDNSPNETGFEVDRSTTGPNGTFTALPTRTAANVTSFSDAGLGAETQYCYKVRGFKVNGKNTDYSAFSNISCSTTPPRPASNTNAAPSNSHAVDVSWTDNSGAEDGYRIERAPSADAVVWETAGTTAGNTASCRDWQRASEVQVCYRVIAFNALGTSEPSNLDCTTPPTGPTGLSASSVVDRTIDLKWSDNSGVEGGYEVQRSAADGPSSVVAMLPPNTVTYRDAGLEGDTRYTYLVRATKDGGFSDFSNSATAVSASIPPPAPSGTTVRPNGSSSVIVAWTYTPATEDGFRVERSIDNEVSWTTVVAAVERGARAIVDGGRTSEQKVWYRVFAFNAKGNSDPSNTAFTTPPAAPTELTATPATDGSIQLTWRDNSSVEDGYEAQRLVCYQNYYYYYNNYCEYVTVGVVDLGVTSFRETGLNPGEFYQYRVVARKDGGYSDPSNETGATASAPSPD